MNDPLTLYGTDEPVPDRTLLVAGPLSAVLEAGQLRDIRWHGVEVVRGISWLVRDAGWRTLSPALDEPMVRQDDTGFKVRYQGRSATPDARFTLEAEITGRASGELTFEVAARVEADLLTNRTGFVVLHPDTLAGLPLEVLHPDGGVEAMVFPTLIMPDQPALDIAGLTHRDRGIVASVSFAGGIFEMEDQRNWLDASFKTYVRPLRLPKPYVIAAGTVDRQGVTLRVEGSPEPIAKAALADPPAAVATMPHLWLRAWPGSALPEPVSPHLANGLIAILDLLTPDAGALVRTARFAAERGWPFGVEALLPLREPEAEADRLLRLIADLPVERLLIGAARDLKSRPSNSIPDGEWPLDAVMAALRRQGFAGLIGAGTPAFFTEFNRNPPPASDFTWFGGAAIVHAADDASVFETAGVLPAVLASATALLPGTPLFPGPLTIAPAVSPYAPTLAENPRGRRICMAATDPRHAAAFGAAYLAAVVAHLAGMVAAAAPLWLNGPSGCLAPDGSLWPVGGLHAALARIAGARLVASAGCGPLISLTWEHPSRGAGDLQCNTSSAVASAPPQWPIATLSPYEVRLSGEHPEVRDGSHWSALGL
jgi:hypothetical protein